MNFEAALLALTLNIFFEARGESEMGQHAVADTVITRVIDPRYPDSVEDVVLQHKQFSWVREKKVMSFVDLIDLQHRVLHSKGTKPADIAAYKRAEKLARKVLRPGYKPRYRFTHFHSTKVHPYWARYQGAWIGRHIFYRL